MCGVPKVLRERPARTAHRAFVPENTSARVSPAGTLIASASPSAVTGKYLAVWEKIGNDWKLECRFEDQWARHWEKIHRQILGEDHRREQGDAACRGRRFNNRYPDSQMEGR
jgi:hypothetical protein